jgi:uncharacterized protein (TIGR02444 family)
MRQDGGTSRGAAESLWRFSLALYTRPGVADALIGLQDRAGIDVNLILFALWTGATRGRRLDAAELAAAEAAVEPLARGAVQPLRRLRRELKGAANADAEALRRRVLSLELAAERQVLGCLAALTENRTEPATPLMTAAANLAVYLGDEARSAEADVLRRAVASLMRVV